MDDAAADKSTIEGREATDARGTSGSEHTIELGISGLPDRLYSGLPYTFTIEAFCSSGCDLGGDEILIAAEDGRCVFDGPLVPTEAKPVFSTGPITTISPDAPGTYGWHITFIPAASPEAAGDIAPEAASDTCVPEQPAHPTSGVDFSFDVSPHITSISVWDVKSPAAIGSDISIRVGVECCAGCDLEGDSIAIINEYGDQVGDGHLHMSPESETPSSNSGKRLFQTTVEVIVPFDVGTYEWKAVYSPSDTDTRHPQAQRRFTFAADEAGDHAVRLLVDDARTGAPLANAIVTLVRSGGFPYRTRTDHDGHAEVLVPPGDYHLGIVKSDFDDATQQVTVADDATELHISMRYNPDPLG